MMNIGFLQRLGYSDPNIIECNNDGFIIGKNDKIYGLFQDNKQWMMYDSEFKTQVFEFYSHWKLAQGHCICTGLGFLLRENWLLSKKEVTKITVIERNKKLIEYHWQYNPEIMKKLEIIAIDVYDFKGSCDTLLIDNFEGDIKFEVEFCKSASIITKNISHERMWFWPLEYLLTAHYKNYLRFTLKELYEMYKRYFKLHTLPDLTEMELFDLCYVFNSGNFQPCDFNRLSI